MAIPSGTRVRVHDRAMTFADHDGVPARYYGQEGVTQGLDHRDYRGTHRVHFDDGRSQWIYESFLSPVYNVGTRVTVGQGARNGATERGAQVATHAGKSGTITEEYLYGGKPTPVAYRVRLDEGTNVTVNSRYLAVSTERPVIGRRITVPAGEHHGEEATVIRVVRPGRVAVQIVCGAVRNYNIADIPNWEPERPAFAEGVECTVDPRAFDENACDGVVSSRYRDRSVFLIELKYADPVRGWAVAENPGGRRVQTVDERFLIPVGFSGETTFVCVECTRTKPVQGSVYLPGGRACSDCAVNCVSCSRGVLAASTVQWTGRLRNAMTGVASNGPHTLCERCSFRCGGCENTLPRAMVVVTVDRVNYCQECARACARCGNWFRPEPGDEDATCLRCGGGCKCVSPQLEFAIRNDGADPLANDVRRHIQLPSGTLTVRGVQAIREYLNGMYYAAAEKTGKYDESFLHLINGVPVIGDEWTTKEGNFPKRLSRWAYKTHGIKVSAEVMSEIGNIGSAHSQGAEFDIEVTRNLNLSAAEMGHSGSCWWQSYFVGRCILKSHGGFGLRAFDQDKVIGRAWVWPLKLNADKLVPTFETMEPAAFAVFNGYGVLTEYTAPRIVAYLAGMTYRKVGLEAGSMYINGNSTYLIAPEDIAVQYKERKLKLNGEPHDDLFAREQASMEKKAKKVKDKEMAHA